MQRSRPHNQEVLLAEYAERVRKQPAGYRAVHLHLSQLRAFNRRDHHIRIAANSLQGLVQRSGGALFVLRNNDIVATFRDIPVSEIDETVVKLRFLFGDDPLAKANAAAKDGQGGFCTWYDLAWQHGAFMRLTQQLVHRSSIADSAMPSEERTRGAGDEITEPLTAEHLCRLESQLRSADLAPLIRRQPVCALPQETTPTPVFCELFVSINELRRMLMPAVDLSSSRWLFQHLTEMLDRRLLRVLPEIARESSMATSININVGTLLSPAFLQFDRKLRSMTKKTLVLELQPIDIFGDMGAYMFARDFVRDRGYRVCMDSLSHLTFPLVDRRHFGFDFEKVFWSPDIDGDFNEERRSKLAEAVQAAGATRVILAHCDSPRAVEFGQSIGITLFQGWHIDNLVKQSPTLAETSAA